MSTTATHLEDSEDYLSYWPGAFPVPESYAVSDSIYSSFEWCLNSVFIKHDIRVRGVIIHVCIEFYLGAHFKWVVYMLISSYPIT